MPDNLTTTTTVSTVPSGTVISTDDAGASGHVQRVKLAYSADGVATHAQVDADGMLVNLGTNNDVTVTGTVTANAGTGPWPVTDNGGSITVDNGGTFATQASGSVAHDAADSGNPVKVGGKAYNFDGTVPGTAVAENDRANFISDVYGRQFVETAHPNYWRLSSDYASAQTNTSLKTAPGAGLKLYITDVIISNGAPAGNNTLLDGSGGTVLLEIYPAINGGVAMPFRTPIALTANTALVITSTTVTTHSVTITGYTAP